MFQLIGLIVAVYAIKDVWLGLPFLVRFIIVAAASGAGALIIAILTLLLLLSGSRGPL